MLTYVNDLILTEYDILIKKTFKFCISVCIHMYDLKVLIYFFGVRGIL